MSNNTPIALITGANRGLGKNAALKLAGTGVDLIITYRNNADEANAVVAGIRALGRHAVALRLDVADTRGFADFANAVSAVLASESRQPSAPPISASSTDSSRNDA